MDKVPITVVLIETFKDRLKNLKIIQPNISLNYVSIKTSNKISTNFFVCWNRISNNF